jgi:hypothetical protein
MTQAAQTGEDRKSLCFWYKKFKSHNEVHEHLLRSMTVAKSLKKKLYQKSLESLRHSFCLISLDLEVEHLVEAEVNNAVESFPRLYDARNSAQFNVIK